MNELKQQEVEVARASSLFQRSEFLLMTGSGCGQGIG